MRNEGLIKSSVWATTILVIILSALKNIMILIPALVPLILVVLYTFHWIPRYITQHKRLKDILIIKNITPSHANSLTVSLDR